MKVPFLDLKAHHAPHRAEFSRAIEEVIDRGAFAGGSFVGKFEEEFASYCQSKHAIGVGSGTEALWLPLLALGIGPGDEVITVPNSFFATAEAISHTGATPVFVDIDEERHTMDPVGLEAAVTERTKAIIPVHLYGQTADMDPILEFARERGLYVIEDAAQAHGAEYKGRRAGSLGDAGCFSFYPGKNLGAFGEAGAITTSDPELHAKMCQLRDHGQSEKYHHTLIGWNCRMDGIQAAVLSLKLARLEQSTELRRARAADYDRLLASIDGVKAPRESPDARHVYHVYAVRVRDRERIMQHLGDREIGCGIHYPVPIHLQPAYAGLGYGKGAFPVSERCAPELLSLPMFPELGSEQVELACDVLRESVEAGMVA
jgi:dTDP-4-amino-4,6-dideoxygalactose transaminase